MPGVTPVYGFPFLEPFDPPAIDTGLQDLAEAVDEELRIRAKRYNTVNFTASGTYVQSEPGVRGVWVQVQGGGGAGGGLPSTSSQSAVAGGGQGGGYAHFWVPVEDLTDSVTVTVGAGGVGVSGTTGGTGGASAFGPYGSVPGGIGGGSSVARTSFGTSGGGNSVQSFTGSASPFVFAPGGHGQNAFVFDNTASVPGSGGWSALSGNARSPDNTVGRPGLLYGGGASGGRKINVTSAAVAGSNGGAGIVIVTEIF
jgi:hypothetical protein